MGAPAARVAELSRLWVEAGHEVSVLTGFPNHPTGIVPAEYRRKIWRGVAREQFHGVDVVRTWLLPFPNRRAYERILNYGSFAFSAAGAGMFLARPDVVIATSPQLLVGLAGYWIARWKQARFVFEVRDLWPESLAAVGAAGMDSSFYRALSGIAGFLYGASDHIVVVTPAFKHHLISNWQVRGAKISVVENGVDTNLFLPVLNQEIRQALQLDGKFVVSYIGTIGMAHGLETLVEVAAQLQHSTPEVLFIIVGDGAEKERITSLLQARGLTNVRFIAQQPREKIPAYICASNVCLVTLKKSDLFKTVLPTKMLEFMACARPVILGVDGLARQILNDANAGIFVEPENAVKMTAAIRRLATDRSLSEELGRNGRDYVLRNFTRESKAEAYLQVLNDVLEVNESCLPAVAELRAGQ